MISKNSIISLKILFSLFLFSVLITPHVASAEDFDPAKGFVTCGVGDPVIKQVVSGKETNVKNPAFKPCTICDIFATLARIYDFIVKWLAAPLAVLAISIGAVFMIIGANSPTIYETGKKIVRTAIIGLFLIFASWLLIDTILHAVGYINADKWWTLDIDCPAATPTSTPTPPTPPPPTPTSGCPPGGCP